MECSKIAHLFSNQKLLSKIKPILYLAQTTVLCAKYKRFVESEQQQRKTTQVNV